jgi:hypothetical protein
VKDLAGINGTFPHFFFIILSVMNNTEQTLKSFIQVFQEYIQVNGMDQALGYLHGTLKSLSLSDYDLELLQVLTRGMNKSTEALKNNI